MSQESLKYNGIQNLSKIGVVVGQKICKTLQGSVYHGKLNHKKENVSIDVVIKRATIKLLKNKLAKINKNFMIPVSENIIKEAQIMKYIESLNPPNGFLKVHATLNDDYNYFLIMEYGGKSLLNHVRKYHKLIELNKLSVSEWKNHVKILFKQLVNMIYFLHNKARICHMDISLENILIKGCVFNSGTFTTHGQVSICDFGLAEHFDVKNKNFMSAKYVGKTVYQSPELFSRKSMFDARKNDIWSLGICLFMLQIGLQPLNKASMKDKYFKNIINGHLSKMIETNGKLEYNSKWFLNIMNNVLTPHEQRWNIENISKNLL
mmetsp:Transcript_2194/g.2708  ORF Transcript_2194/g.2708 Transcript_2194/m.2708 type:complete len:320 (-) Transcript_2194:76-1035(-)